MEAKPSGAFAAGLWIGAIVAALIAFVYVRSGALRPTKADAGASAKVKAQEEQIRLLQHDNARLAAEVTRLKQTAAELKSNLDRAPQPAPETEPPGSPPAGTLPPASKPAVDVPTRRSDVVGAEITGKVLFEGRAVVLRRIKTDADPKCAAMHAETPLLSEDIVVNENGTLRWVFVYINAGLPEGKTYDKPKEAVVLEQKGCRYEPHVFGMMAKQALVVRNSDDTSHNIHALPTASPEFNIGQPSAGMETTKTFATPEVMVKFKCDVHPWMSAYCGVLNHPFYAVTGEDGTFALQGLPAGEYEVVAWHEKYGAQAVTVKVGEREAREITFTYRAPE